MIEIGITKKQHYVSQGILKHFADQQKKIYELFIDKSIVTKKTAIGAGVAVWGVINLLEGYGNDNPGANAHVR